MPLNESMRALPKDLTVKGSVVHLVTISLDTNRAVMAQAKGSGYF